MAGIRICNDQVPRERSMVMEPVRFQRGNVFFAGDNFARLFLANDKKDLVLRVLPPSRGFLVEMH